MALYPVYPGVDIVFAETEDDVTQVTSERGLSPGLYNWVLDSRLIPTHEYGYFALCSMLFKKDPATFMSAYSGAMLSRMDADPDETNVAGYINEGFADFFASQVAGGTNQAPARSEHRIQQPVRPLLRMWNGQTLRQRDLLHHGAARPGPSLRALRRAGQLPREAEHRSRQHRALTVGPTRVKGPPLPSPAAAGTCSEALLSLAACCAPVPCVSSPSSP
jgi:hypothetical protein